MSSESDTFTSFAEGLKAFGTKGIAGKPLRLTKKRAVRLKWLLKEMIYRLPDCEHHDRDDCHCNDIFYEAMGWVHQQIDKRYSGRDLAL